MIASYRVKDSKGNTVGFIIDNTFYTDYKVKENISLIDNLSIIKNGIIKATKSLPEVSYKDFYNKEVYAKLKKENPFKRDIQKELIAWKNNKLHKVLQLEGTRQIGKTTELLKFAYKYYEYVIYINLSNDIYNFIDVVKNGCNPMEFESYCRRCNIPHFVNSKKTILIIDEIQISEIVYNSIRSIFLGINCDIIVTGSYLGQTVKEKYFLPAGTISYLHMYPMSFREVCDVFGIAKLLDNISLYNKSRETEYTKLYKIYDLYIKIGGYPEVVKTYKATNEIEDCYDVIESLLETFKKESRNYFSNSKEPLIFKTVYTEAIKIMCKEKKGSGNKLLDTVTQLAKSSQKMMISRDEVANAIAWLVYSGIIGECGLYNNGDIKEYIASRRIYYMDCGIASYIGKQTQIEESDKKGLLSENFVFTELYRLYTKKQSQKLVKGDSPCFSIYNQNELDFMVVDKDGKVYGIEVKTDSGEPKSLKVYIDKHLIEKGIVAKRTKGGYGERFDTIPIFAVGERFPYTS